MLKFDICLSDLQHTIDKFVHKFGQSPDRIEMGTAYYSTLQPVFIIEEEQVFFNGIPVTVISDKHYKNNCFCLIVKDVKS